LKVAGLTGGIASGKSEVAAFMKSLGAVVVDADQVAHKALARAEVVTELTARWGDGVVDAARQPIRSEIAQRVFGPQGDRELEWLEDLLHPLVRREIEDRMERMRTAGTRVLVLDVPLLFERNWQHHCDWVVFVDAPLEQRRARAAERGWDPDELERREARQWNVQRKRAAADYVVENRADLSALHAALTRLWNNWNIN